ncbi:MAG: lipid A deacylase LpxR family protein [Desulfuromonadales bacterium]|nr:lipid A deacylase LpxR family protein [Desulfuromonadales bacterium]
MNNWIKKIWLPFLLLVSLLNPADLLAVEEQQSNPWAQSIFFENDLFNGTDSNYTNGVKYSLISPDLSPHAIQGRLPRKVLEWIHKIPFIRDSGPEYSHKAEFSFGQNMYTPADISRSDLITDDRPYAGWSYVGFAYHRKAKVEEHLDFLDSVEIQMGIVGPQSYADETQTLVHELRSIDTAKGWDHQLKNEPGLVVAFERKWLFSPNSTSLLSADAIGHAGGTLGNVATYFNTGLEVRYGLNLPRSFGVSLIRPAGSTLFEPSKKPILYLFGAVNGKYVVRDIFLDGNTFADSHSIDKEDLVADFAAGVTFGYRNLKLTYTNVTRTKQFVGQDDSHNFGSLTLSFFYPLW